MRVHILGIGGTFMAGIAVLARAMGHEVYGSDGVLYPPMSDQLAAEGFKVFPYTNTECLEAADIILVGNALSRGNPAVEHMLNRGLCYQSAPAWLASVLLQHRWVLAVSGTHGKTTTTSLLSWILEVAGLSPGFLIGGMPHNFGVSARLGGGSFFVIEADEYDTAFFDKQPKFMHIRPRTLVINTLEYDHADIYPNLASIQQQFHYLVRTVPGIGHIIRPTPDANIDVVLAKGVYSPVITVGQGAGNWQAREVSPCARQWTLWQGNICHGAIHWDLPGLHNIQNALLAIAAAYHVGVLPAVAIEAIQTFRCVKRRLEVVWNKNNIIAFDDFAHHPTAINKTLQTVRALDPTRRLVAIVDIGTRSLQAGANYAALLPALARADLVILYKNPRIQWDMTALQAELIHGLVVEDIEGLRAVVRQFLAGDQVVLMSNSGLGSQLRETLVAQLASM